MSVTVQRVHHDRGAADAVWRAVEHIESHTEWMQDAVRITFKSEQHSGVGAEFECLTRVGPLFTTDRFVVTRWRPGELMGIEHRGAVTGDAEFRLGRSGAERTEFCWEERLRFPWWLGGVVGEQVGRPGAAPRLEWQRGAPRSARSRMRVSLRPGPGDRRTDEQGESRVDVPTQSKGRSPAGNGAFVGGVAAGLAEHGYTETEYFIAGRADRVRARRATAWRRVADTADYRTRILVYRPADPARFNGTVLVEWLNVSGGLDGAADWTSCTARRCASGVRVGRACRRSTVGVRRRRRDSWRRPAR